MRGNISTSFDSCQKTIDVIYYSVIWTDNESILPEADTEWQEGKYTMIRVLQGCILKLSLHSVNSVLIPCGTGNMQSAILLSFVTSSSLLPCGLQSTNPPMPYYISPSIVYNVYAENPLREWVPGMTRWVIRHATRGVRNWDARCLPLVQMCKTWLRLRDSYL